MIGVITNIYTHYIIIHVFYCVHCYIYAEEIITPIDIIYGTVSIKIDHWPEGAG